jgi:ferric-dicitrate binding protein FerR (iron transport regulator)
MSGKENFTDLADKFMRGSLTAAERDTFFQLFDQEEISPELEQLLWESYQQSSSTHIWPEDFKKMFAIQLTEKVIVDKQSTAPTTDLESAVNDLPSTSYPQVPVHRVHFLKSAWFRYAAAFLLIAGTAAYLYLTNRPQKETAVTSPTENIDILPGGNKAILTLADGSTIVLDSADNGEITNQGNTKILKLDAGSLSYSAGTAGGAIGYNTISTPNGGQYQITLPDGSKVWLNAASSIKFPTVFNESRRNVEMIGEAYFEIAPKTKQPFLVKVGGSEIEVLGTHFNVMAYTNENIIKTTLLEGSIKFTKDKKTVLLRPGQQSCLFPNSKIQLVDNADIDQAVAWKNGVQAFNGADIKTIMRQVERWYDIEVVYEGTLPDRTFSGDIPRTADLSRLLKLFEASKIHFVLDETKKKLTVLP